MKSDGVGVVIDSGGRKRYPRKVTLEKPKKVSFLHHGRRGTLQRTGVATRGVACGVAAAVAPVAAAGGQQSYRAG